MRPGPGRRGRAYIHSAELALLANVGFVVLALVLVLALPRRIPGHDELAERLAGKAGPAPAWFSCPWFS